MSDLITNAFNNLDPKNEKFVEKNIDIVEEIYALMQQIGIVSQKELAKLMEKKESEVSKLLSGIQNMTLRSITNLEVALGQDIILTASKAKAKFETIQHPFQLRQFQRANNQVSPITRPFRETETATIFKLKVA